MASKLVCDRCDKTIDERKPNEYGACSGNCCKCGDDLCAECAVLWDENGYCKKCAGKLIHRFRYRVDNEVTIELTQKDYQDLIDAGNEHQMETCAYNQAWEEFRSMGLSEEYFDIILAEEKEVLSPEEKEYEQLKRALKPRLDIEHIEGA